MPENKLMTIKEVAAWLDVSEDTIRRWIRERGMPHFQVTDRGALRFDRESVTEWLRRDQAQASE